ncbi:MAG: ATP-binding protein [Candidatus Cryptobacteroides sp.]
MIDSVLYSYMEEQLRKTPTAFKRYLYSDIPWENRLTGIVGARGIGKSTMLKQYIIEHGKEYKFLYVAADHTYFATHTLTGLADDFVKEGGTHLYIDEIHKYKGWSRELKQIYDVHSDLRIVFTGSSILDIESGEADLSRRALMYTMEGLSFRESLGLFHGIETPAYSMSEILENKASIRGVEHPLPLFREYLKTGYYPFSKEIGFEKRMQQIVSQTIESDIAQYADLKASTARKLIKMLAIVSTLAPYKPSAEKLAAEIGVSKNNVPDYLVFMEKAGLIGQLRDDTGGIRGLGKVEKVYINNPNLMNILAGGNPDIGNIRETFFYNQTKVMNDVIASRDSDFVIGDNTFEIGGKKKGRKQIEDIPGGIIVKDDIEYGHGIVIPLWAFGLNY